MNFTPYTIGAAIAIGALTTALVGPQPRPLAWIVFALTSLRIVWAYLRLRCQTYSLSSERFAHRYGVLSRSLNEIELYRVKDVVLRQPFLLRICGLSNITVVGFDEVKPVMVLKAVRDGEEVRECFRNFVEARRDVKRVGVFEGA